MFAKVRNVLLISGIGLLSGLIKNILFAREFTKADLGLFSLLITFVAFVNPLTIVGQQNAIVRFLANRLLNDYNWYGQIKKIILICICITIPLTFGFSYFFSVNSLAIIFLLVSISCSAIIDIVCAVIRANGQYELSTFFFRTVNIFQLLTILLLLFFGIFKLQIVLILFSAIYILYSIILILYAIKKYPTGEKPFPIFIWKDGLFFWLSDLSLLVILSFDKFFIPKLLSIESLGEYFAIFSIMRGYDLAIKSVEFVLLPFYKKNKTIKIGWILYRVLVIGSIISLAYWFLGEKIVHIFYDGKFDNNTFLIPYFCILGFIRLLYVVPFSIIGGALKQRYLKHLSYINIITVFAFIICSFILIQIYGLKGAVISSIIIWTLKTISGYGILLIGNKSN